MKSNVKISIITAVYNSEKTLEDTLKSVQSQDYDNIEHIIVDGASKDSSLAIVEQFARKDVVLLSEPDKGIYDAFNKGLSLATGNVVGYLNSDDYLAHDKVICQIAAAFNNDPDLDIVYGNLDYIAEDSDQIKRKWRDKAFDYNNLKTGWMPAHPTFYMKNERYKSISNFNLKYTIAADCDLMLRSLLLPNITAEHIADVFVKMRVGGASNNSISTIIEKFKQSYSYAKENNLSPLRLAISKPLQKIFQFI